MLNVGNYAASVGGEESGHRSGSVLDLEVGAIRLVSRRLVAVVTVVRD